VQRMKTNRDEIEKLIPGMIFHDGKPLWLELKYESKVMNGRWFASYGQFIVRQGDTLEEAITRLKEANENTVS